MLPENWSVSGEKDEAVIEKTDQAQSEDVGTDPVKYLEPELIPKLECPFHHHRFMSS